jgi:hypothetical protein
VEPTGAICIPTPFSLATSKSTLPVYPLSVLTENDFQLRSCRFSFPFPCTTSIFHQAISEDRTFTPKFGELKLHAYFLHASPDYLLVGRIGNGTVGQGTAYTSSSDVYTTNLRSTNGVNFYLVRQQTNTKTTNTNFQLRVNASITAGGSELEIVIPRSGNITLAGRESKIIVTNYPFGNSTLLYSTTEVRE